jgi:hypothetical protein
MNGDATAPPTSTSSALVGSEDGKAERLVAGDRPNRYKLPHISHEAVPFLMKLSFLRENRMRL